MAVIYTHNDSANPPNVFTVDVPTGETVGDFDMGGVGLFTNPQAIRLDWTDGLLYLADIGDPQNNRTDIDLCSVPEPGPGFHGTIPAKRYGISYPFGPRDAEALAINPLNGLKYIITKEPVGRLVRFPKVLAEGNVTPGTDMNKPMAALVTDATFTLDAKWLLIRCQGVRDTLVYNAATWAFDGVITTPTVAEGRSITMEPNGKCFLVGSESQFAPIFRVCLPIKYQPSPPTITVLAGSRDVGDVQTYRLTGFFPSSPNITVTIERPNGTVFQTVSLTPNVSGTVDGTFTPNVVGTWTIKALQTITGGTFSATRNVVITSPRPPPPPPPPPCSTADKPADVLSLVRWKLTLPKPLGSSGDPDEIFQPQLNNYEHPSYFFVACPGPVVVFRAPVNGATTSNSGNPRSELREMNANGSNETEWSMNSGTHTMEIVQAITHRPDKNDGQDPVVAGQIHDDQDDVTVCRLHGANIRATRDDEVTGAGTFVLIPNYVLGTYFTLKMIADSTGIRYYINGVFKGKVSKVRSGLHNYFKAGCYTQANESNGSGYGEVRIKSLKITHT